MPGRLGGPLRAAALALGAAALAGALFGGCMGAPAREKPLRERIDEARLKNPIEQRPPPVPFRRLPRMRKIPTADILYAPDLVEDLFWHRNRWYWVVHGQWFVAPHWGGDYRACREVPAEFLNIPAEHEKGRVVRWHPDFLAVHGYRLQGVERAGSEHNLWNPRHAPDWVREKERKEEAEP